MPLFGLFPQRAGRAATCQKCADGARGWDATRGREGRPRGVRCLPSGSRREQGPCPLRHVSEQQSSDWTGRENSGMEATRGKGGGASTGSETRGKEQGALRPPGATGRLTSTRRCAAAFPSRGSRHRRPPGAAPASPGCFSKVQRDYVTRSPSRVENRDIALIYSSTAGAASSQGPPSLSTFTPMPGVGPSPGYRGLPSGAGAQSGSSEKRRRGRALETLCCSFSR